MSATSRLINFNVTSPAAPDGFENGAFQLATSSSGTDPGTGLPIFDASVNVPSTGGVAVKTANYTLTAADCGKLIVANSASALVFTLPASIPFAQWQVQIANIGAGALSVVPGGSLTLDGATSSVTVGQFQSLSIATDGTNHFSGRGRPPIKIDFLIGNGSAGTSVALIDSALVAGSVSKCTVVVTKSDGSTPLTFKIKQNGTDVFATDPTVGAGASPGSISTFTTLTSSPLAIAEGDIFTMDITSGSSSWEFIAKLR